MFDTIIIGGGISGCSIAYYLNKSNQKVAIVEKDTILSGGSGAAGAFISPMIGKPNPYNEFVNKSFEFSVNFYKENIPEAFYQSGILRLPKNETDFQKFIEWKNYILEDFEYKTKEELDFISHESCKFGGYYFRDGGVVDVKKVANFFIKDIEIYEDFYVTSLKHDGEFWHINDKLKAKNVVLAIGGYKELIDIPYPTIRSIYGFRQDVKSDAKIPYSLHKDVSISFTKDGFGAIGATHQREVEFDGINTPDFQDDRLLEKYKEITDCKSVEAVKTYKGMRSASVDYFPILGNVIDAKGTLEKYPYIKTGSRVPPSLCIRYPSLFIHSGFGARAYVITPYSAMLLSKLIVDKIPIDKDIEISRLFYRWARKNQGVS